MPRIGYDVTSLVGMCTGVGNYTRQLLAHMLDVAGEHDFLLMANRQDAVQDVAPSARARPMIQRFPQPYALDADGSAGAAARGQARSVPLPKLDRAAAQPVPLCRHDP